VILTVDVAPVVRLNRCSMIAGLLGWLLETTSTTSPLTNVYHMNKPRPHQWLLNICTYTECKVSNTEVNSSC